MIRPKQQICRWSLVVGLDFASSLLAQPRDIRFDHLSVEQGLSNFSLNAIVQDGQGFLWFGTEDGLNKYDGYTFIIYKANPADTTSLPSSYISHLYRDRENYLWVVAGGHLLRYDQDTDKFIRFTRLFRHADSLAVPGRGVNAIFEDRQGDYWIATARGLFRYDRQREILRAYLHDPQVPASISSDAAMTICEDTSGTLWIGTFGGGLNRFNREQGSFTRYRQKTSGLSSDDIFCLQADRQGNVWIGTHEGVNRYDARTGAIRRYGQDPPHPPTLGGDIIFDLYEDSQGILWIGTFHLGLWRYEPKTGQFSHYAHDPNDHHSLSQNRIQCLYEDHSGVMWLGTYRGGLNRYDRQQDEFVRYPSAADINAILHDRRGNLWLGTDGAGLLRYDQHGKLTAQFRHDPKNPQSLSNDGILAIREDPASRDGDLWIGTGSGLNRYDARRRLFVRYRHELFYPPGTEQNEVKTIFIDADNEIWFGTKGAGLGRLDRATQTFTYYRHDPHNPRSLSNNHVWAIIAGPNDDLWIGTFGGGIDCFDKRTQTFTHFPPNAQNPRSLNAGGIYSLYADTSGYLWAGTFGGGLNRLDLRTGLFTHYTDRDGLPDNFVKGILPGAQGFLWLSTDKGLSRFDPRAGSFKNFTMKDGLLSNVLLSGAYYRNQTGQMFFGGVGGAIAFHPDALKENPHAPPVVITSFKVFDQPLPRRVPQQSHLEPPAFVRLSYRHNFFSFEFVALDFTEPSKNEYAYKLEGFDRDWVHCGKRRYANYTNVDPGEYTFRVKGANSDGVWNETGAAVNIAITPPYWQTWWFRALAAILLGAAAYGAYRYRVTHLLQMERLRTRLAADLHDEIAGNLSSIAMFGKIVEEEAVAAGEPQMARSEMLQRIIALSQESVIAIREIIWAIDPKPETIHDLLMRVRDFAVNLCRAQNMILKFQVLPQAQLPGKNLSPEQRKHLWLLLKEAVTNAVKHSGGTELNIGVVYEKGQLTVSIIDNGVGMNGARQTARFSGKGLETMKNRAQQLPGALEIFTHPAGGTVVVLSAKL